MTMFFRYILLLAAALTPGLAGAARSDWVPAEGGRGRVRVVLDAQTGRVAGAVEIALEPGWHTYWREPGEAGIPPVFDFSGSENVEKIEVAYPAPERLDDGSGVSLVYRDEAVFPLKVTPVLAKRPVTVRRSAAASPKRWRTTVRSAMSPGRRSMSTTSPSCRARCTSRWG